MSGELSRALPLLILFGLGLVTGIWVFASPFVLGYPSSSGWSSSTWTSLWAGATVMGASGISLIVVLAHSVHATLNPRPEAPQQG